MKREKSGMMKCVATILISAFALAAAAQDAKDAEFNDLCTRVQRAGASVSEDEVIQLLTKARELGRPYAAEVAVKGFAAAQPRVSPRLLLLMADNAFLTGDYRAASARYRNYLSAAAPGQESSDAAASFYETLIRFQGLNDEAYDFMKTDGEKFRQSDYAKKFDLWFLETAKAKSDLASCVRRLKSVYAEKTPAEQKNFFYGYYLDWVMQSIRRPTTAMLPLLTDIQQLLSLAGAVGDKAAKYGLYSANLQFKAESVGKSIEEAEKGFDPVFAAAKALFDASPTRDTLTDALDVFSAGFQAQEWQTAIVRKREFFSYAFGKLSDADRTALVPWIKKNLSGLLGSEQWAALLAAHPKAFAEAGELIDAPMQKDMYAKQAAFLEGKQSLYAAVVNSLAAGNDLESCAKNLLDKESWHLPPVAVYDLLSQQIWPALKKMPSGDDLPADHFDRFIAKFGMDVLAKTPVPLFDAKAASAMISAAWRHGDRSKIADLLHSLDWIPYTEKQRQEIFDAAYKGFLAWANEVRSGSSAIETAKARIEAYERAEAQKKKAAEARTAAEAALKSAAEAAASPGAGPDQRAAAQRAEQQAKTAAAAWANADAEAARTAGPAADAKAVLDKFSDMDSDAVQALGDMENAFKQVMDPAVFSPDKAPTPLCANLARAMSAVNAKNQDEFEAAARQTYSEIKDFASKKTPFGSATLDFISRSRPDAFDTTDMQAEFLAGQLAAYEAGGDLAGVYACFKAICTGRSGWPNQIPSGDQAAARKIATAFEKTLLQEIGKGKFDAGIFNAFRQVRRGNGWEAGDIGPGLMGQLIEKKTLLNVPLRINSQTAAGTYMWLVRNEFARLKDQYPAESYFDDMYVEECSKDKALDFSYWNMGADSKGKITSLASRLLQQYTTLPAVSQEFTPDKDLWKWHAQCLLKDAEWRKQRQVSEPDRDKLAAMLENAFGKTRFDEFAMGSYYFEADADIENPAGRKTFFDKLGSYLARAKTLPAQAAPPNLKALEKAGALSAAEVDVLISIFPHSPHVMPQTWFAGRSYELLPTLLYDSMVSQKRYAELLNLAPHFWKIARDLNNKTLMRKLADAAETMEKDGFPDIAAQYSVVGLDVAGNKLSEDVRVALMGVRSKALVNVGGAIPVDRTDPKYPIFASQASYSAGNYQNAWELYLSAADRAPGMLTELDPMFSLWLISRDTEAGEYPRAENLARNMMQWVDSLENADREIKGRVMIAYADIALARQEFPRARALLQRIAASKEFDDTRVKDQAELSIANVDRLTRNFESAIDRLNKLMRKMDRQMQTESAYMLALVKYDQEEFLEARDILKQLFTLDPNHVAGRILEGRVNLRIKRYEQAANIEIGLSSMQNAIVPGKPMRVRLEDRSLAVAGGAGAIELRVWTDSGDEEFFNLLPGADSRTIFEGRISTALGAPVKGDHILQVSGSDTVYCGFSDNFRKTHGVAQSDPLEMSVASDSELYASSGELLDEETEAKDWFDQMLREAAQEAEAATRDRARTAGAAAPAVAPALSRPRDVVTPGNQIYVRVVDFDQSVSAEPDTINVRVTAFSGDEITAFELKETESHSGIFEGRVQTAPAGAMAFATDSEEGSLPLYAIMSKEDYPPWVALPNSVKPKVFTVDLNDNVSLGAMRVDADVPGRRLKNFVVQTSMNGRDFESVASWPTPLAVWSGNPEFNFVNYTDTVRISSLDGIRRYIYTDSVGRNVSRATVPMSDMFVSAGDTSISLEEAKIPIKWDSNSFVGHLRLAFFVPRRQTRTFKLADKNPAETRTQANAMMYFMAFDGIAVSNVVEDGIVFRKAFSRGVHTIDVYCHGPRAANGRFELLYDSDEPPFMIPCPIGMFDPEKVPEIAAAVAKQASATVTANQDNVAFDVQFANMNARVIRLVINDFETDAPAIRKIGLTNAEGEKLLPTDKDILASRHNDTLEIISGDRISVTYNDPIVLTKGKEIQERIMQAEFFDAEISAGVTVVQTTGRGGESFFSIYRFSPGEKVDVRIFDPDMDVSDEKDTVPFTVKTPLGKPLELKAIETEPHSGVFVGSVFPVTGDPQRDNEIRVEPEEELEFSYVDNQNIDPGVVFTRVCVVPQAFYAKPELRAYAMSSVPIEPSTQTVSAAAQPARRADELMAARQEFFEPRRQLLAMRPLKADEEAPVTSIRGAPVLVELTFPFMARSEDSSAKVFVQTVSQRKEAGLDETAPFDPSIVGTTGLTARISDFPPSISSPPGYASVQVQGDPYAFSPEEDGRFSFVFTNNVDDIEIFVGFAFEDPSGATNWTVRRIAMTGDAFVDVMDRFYREAMTNINVGDTLYPRVAHKPMDVSQEKDTINVIVSTSSGFSTNMALMETFEREGIFRGALNTVYARGLTTNDTIDANTVPVDYGDVVTIAYSPAEGAELVTRQVNVSLGGDGDVVSFTKNIKDQELAVKTQFSIAEAYFEMAKQHRAQGREDSLVRRQIAQGRRLLEEAVRDYPNVETRVQADYLLADLDLEFANEAENDVVKRQKYLDAISRFSKIVVDHPDSVYAPKAQYKKALAFEKMGDIDQASEEYVKLSYVYPDSELIAETIARLGNYFVAKGKEYAAKAGEQKEELEAEKYKAMAYNLYKTGGDVFSRLAPRFPSHALAGKTMVASAQSYIMAEEFDKAVKVLADAVNICRDDPALVAEAMYWRADTLMKAVENEQAKSGGRGAQPSAAKAQQERLTQAYRLLKQVTWDYPESQWAKFARGRLTSSAMAAIAAAEGEGGEEKK